MSNLLPCLPAKQRIRQAFDQAAVTYDAAADVQREVSDRLAEYLDPVEGNFNPADILDAGCGTGYGVLRLQRRWPHADLTLIDFAKNPELMARPMRTARFE